MKSQTKVKSLIVLAFTLLFAMICLSAFQIVKIHQARKQIASQQQQINSLREQIDYYEDKAPNNNHDTIGE